MSDPGLTGLTEVQITVSDFEPHLRFYRDNLGFHIRSRGFVDPAVAVALWGVDEPIEALQLAAGGSDSGYIRLLRFPNATPEERPKVLEAGLFDFDIYTWDMDRAHRELTSAGFEWTAPPQKWEAESTGDSGVVEGWCFAPEGVNCIFVRPYQNKGSKAWALDPSRQYSEMCSSVYIVAEMESEIRFWQSLGLRVGARLTLHHPGVDRFLNLPAGTKLLMALMTAPGSGPARVEVIQPVSEPIRVDKTRNQRPGKQIGLCGWALRVSDIKSAVAAVENGGGRVLTAPISGDARLHGRGTVAAVETPSGVFVELFQPT